MVLKRQIDPATLAAFGRAFHPVTLVFVDWPGDPVRVHSGSGTLDWGGHEWRGLNGLAPGQIVLPAETGSLAMVEGQAVVGADPDGINALHASAEAARGALVQVWFGAVTERAGSVLAGEPFEAFTGSVGGVRDRDEATGATDRLRSLIVQLVAGPAQRARSAAHHTYESQRLTDPDDTAGRWVIGIRAGLVSTLANQKW